MDTESEIKEKVEGKFGFYLNEYTFILERDNVVFWKGERFNNEYVYQFDGNTEKCVIDIYEVLNHQYYMCGWFYKKGKWIGADYRDNSVSNFTIPTIKI